MEDGFIKGMYNNSSPNHYNIISCNYVYWEGSIKGTVSRDFLLLVFFDESVSPQPQGVPLGPFRIFSKIRGDIRKSRCTTGVNDTGDTGGK
jgi:hypothetical protein